MHIGFLQDVPHTIYEHMNCTQQEQDWRVKHISAAKSSPDCPNCGWDVHDTVENGENKYRGYKWSDCTFGYRGCRGNHVPGLYWASTIDQEGKETTVSSTRYLRVTNDIDTLGKGHVEPSGALAWTPHPQAFHDRSSRSQGAPYFVCRIMPAEDF